MTNNYTEQIASLLSGKLEIHDVSEEVIQIMLQEHPYSPYGHLINYLKAKSQKRDDAEVLLTKLATYSPDRAWLQQVLNTTFKDIGTQEATDHAIPSEAKDPNLDKILFEFDFDHSSSEIETDNTNETEASFSEIQIDNQEEVEEVSEIVLSEKSSSHLEGSPTSYIEWLKTFQSSVEISEPLKEAELPPSDMRSTDTKNTIVEKSTRKDNDLFGGIITETLAELLANQGQTEKAISMYERLTLIFPNKSAFFAAKIEQLKHNIT